MACFWCERCHRSDWLSFPDWSRLEACAESALCLRKVGLHVRGGLLGASCHSYRSCLLLGNVTLTPLTVQAAFVEHFVGFQFPRRHRILSARAALTSGLACNAPSTASEAIVARASSGVTSGAIVARPNTLISSISPARRAASRSCRL